VDSNPHAEDERRLLAEIGALNDLIALPGWRILTDTLQARDAYHDQNLHAGAFATPEDQHDRLKDQAACVLIRGLLVLPQALIDSKTQQLATLTAPPETEEE
jgi:hypothetical protein